VLWHWIAGAVVGTKRDGSQPRIASWHEKPCNPSRSAAEKH
jgi:hypothetical protein